ncbi:UNVERIFIED_CONTAM: Retrovirus-related Pol polyprotein from transposon [Sesamum indicum]
MEGESRRNILGLDTTVGTAEPVVQLTKTELQQLMEEAGRKAIVAYERRITALAEGEGARRRLFGEKEQDRTSGALRRDRSKRQPSEVGSSSRDGSHARGPVISRAEVDNVSKQIEKLGKQIDELKKRGEIVSQHRNSPFCNHILTETVAPNFRMPDLPKYDGMKDPTEHLAAFDMVMNLYGQSGPINAKLFVTTLTGKAQEWFTNLPPGSVESLEQLIQKFSFHFASKRKQKWSATHLFTIRQRNDEPLKNFMGRFNNETLEVPDLRIDMMISILIHGLKKGAFASALARDPPSDVEQLMNLAQKYIDEEEMNAMKDGEWRGEYGRDRGYDVKNDKRSRHDRNKEPHYSQKYNKYTPLNTTRARALLMVERKDVLRWPKPTRATPAKKNSSKYCRFHRERGHDTEECYQLKDEIERLVRQGYFKDLISKDQSRGRHSRSRSPVRHGGGAGAGQTAQENAPVKGIIHMIAGGSEIEHSSRARKKAERRTSALMSRQVMNISPELEISFGASDIKGKTGDGNDPMVIKMDIANFTVHKVLVDNGSSADIILKEVLIKMGLADARLEAVNSPLVGFGGSEVDSLGTIELPVSLGDEPRRRTLKVKFLVVNTPFAYNVILGRPGLNIFRAIVSTYHLKMKFPTHAGVGEVACDQGEARRCYNLSIRKEATDRKRKLVETFIKNERIESMDEHREIELVQGDPSKTTKIGASMERNLELMMVAFLRRNADMFAWSASDFKGINPEIIVHRLNLDPKAQPVQQRKRAFGAEKNAIIKEEVDKLLKAGYVSEVRYTDWLSNVVVVPKAAGKWRMCTDFTDLNKACPKDPFPLPRIDQLVDATAGYKLFSMMDAYQGYHQIRMAKEDRTKTSFVTEQGIFCYNVMPFGLKNAGATYQRLVNRMFREQIGKTMEVYVDDMLVKSRHSEQHLQDLEASFAVMRSYGMKLNPTKCTFGVGGGKFLGYMVSSRGIEAEKIKAILELKSPASIKDVQKLTGKIASLNRFISKSADRNLPFFKVLRKPKDFQWSKECEDAFNQLKSYLRTPPLLANPRPGDILYLYLAVSEHAVSSVLVREENKVQNPVYYVSKMLQGAEMRYSLVEKFVLALVTSARRLRPYFQSHKIVVLTNQPLKSILSRPEVSGRLVKWAVELGEHDIEYHARNSERAQVLADFVMELTSTPTQDVEPWMLHVDGSSNTSNGGAGILIQGPGEVEIEVAARLSFHATNNEAEYEALILGLELAHAAGARILEVYTDSQLVAMQIEGNYEAKEQTMSMYLKKSKSLIERFDKCTIQQIPRGENDRADSLSKIGASLSGIKNRSITVMVKDRPAIAEVDIHTIDQPCTWMDELALYLKEGILPKNPSQAKNLRIKATRFTMIESELYKRTADGPLLKCLNDEQAEYVLKEIHEGSCGNHSGARSLAQKVARQGYFWPTLMKDAKRLVQRCESCQRFSARIHSPATPMEPLKVACPFDQWGIDIMGPFPPARAQKKFIILARPKPVARITEKGMIDFIWKNIIYRFGIPRAIVSDNGTQFQGKEIASWLKELKIQQNFTSVGHPQSNGQTEVTNRTILQHLKTRINSKGSWEEELPGVLWAYRTTPRSSTGESPFCLVYGSEAILPAEIGEETHRIASYDPEANHQARAFDLTMIEERRDAALAKILHHKGLMMRRYNKKLRPRELQVGDLVLKKAEVSKHVGKLDPEWEGPFKVVEIRRKGAYLLQDSQGRLLKRPWNIRNLRKFYA